jgi:hypothetical protein
MLKFFFWLLLLANALAFAASRGYLGDFGGKDREPARLANQLNAAQIRIVPASAALAAPAPAAPAAEPAPAVAAVEAPPPAAPPPAAPKAIACYEIGPFPIADANRFDAQLTPLGLGGKVTRHTIGEASSYIVFIPPLASKEAAEKKSAELRALGVGNFFVIPDNTPMRWAISLGVFKTEQAAQNQLAALNKQGVRTARVGPRPGANTRMSFQLRDLSADSKARVERIRLGFPGSETRFCK